MTINNPDTNDDPQIADIRNDIEHRIEIPRKSAVESAPNQEQTRRQKIIELLRQQEAVPLSYLAQHFSLTPKMIEEDLRHIAKNKAYKLEQIPSSCESCGFVFRKREKYRRPSRCPKCKSENINEGMIKLKPQARLD